MKIILASLFVPREFTVHLCFANISFILCLWYSSRTSSINKFANSGFISFIQSTLNFLINYSLSFSCEFHFSASSCLYRCQSFIILSERDSVLWKVPSYSKYERRDILWSIYIYWYIYDIYQYYLYIYRQCISRCHILYRNFPYHLKSFLLSSLELLQ